MFPNIFTYWVLWTMNFSQGGSGPTFFGDAKFETKKFFGIFPFTEYSGLWIFQRWCPGTNFFWSCQICGQKLFRFFSFTEFSGLWICRGREVWVPTFLGHAKFEVKNFRNFLIYRAFWTLNFSWEGSGHQLFLVTLNLRSNIFQIFFIYRALWTLNFFVGGIWGPNFFGHAKFETK